MTKKSSSLVVGKVHALWCGHCQSLAEIWPDFVEQLQQLVSGTKIKDIEESVKDEEMEKVNDTLDDESPKLTAEKGYPTIFRILNGHLQYYDGNRTIEDMLNWASDGLTTKSSGGSKKTRRLRRRKTRRVRKRRITRKRGGMENLYPSKFGTSGRYADVKPLQPITPFVTPKEMTKHETDEIIYAKIKKAREEAIKKYDERGSLQRTISKYLGKK